MAVLETRLTYEQALRSAERLKGHFPTETYTRWIFCGGIRRKTKSLRELVHLIHPLIDTGPMRSEAAKEFGEHKVRNLVWMRLDQLVAANVMCKRYEQDKGFTWWDHYRVVTFQGITHRLLCAVPANWGIMLLAATGPSEFTGKVYAALDKRGVQVRPGLLLVKKDTPAVASSEEEVFELAAMKMVEPQRR